MTNNQQNKLNLAKQYQQLKREFFNYGIVTGTKSKVFDFVVFSFSQDIYVKILKPSEHDNISELISYMRGFTSKRRYINCRYIIVYLNNEMREYDREEVKLK